MGMVKSDGGWPTVWVEAGWGDVGCIDKEQKSVMM
jgi:hypothetical protein